MKKARLDCCAPHMRPWPSGRRLTHSDLCTQTPGKKLVTWEREELADRLRAIADHPAGKLVAEAGWASVFAWDSHPLDCSCVDCTYVTEAMDSAP